MIQIGDIVKFKKEHHFQKLEIITGPCVVDEVRKFQYRVNKPNRYHIKTLNKDFDGSYRMTWVDEHEIISISNLRELKLKELGL